MHKFKLKIISPEKMIYENEIFSVVVPTKDGQITVLANHTNLISLLNTGVITIYESENKSESVNFTTHSGTLQVDEGGVKIIVDELLDLNKFENLDLDEEIKKAKENAKNAMQNESPDFAVFESEAEKYSYLQKILKQK